MTCIVNIHIFAIYAEVYYFFIIFIYFLFYFKAVVYICTKFHQMRSSDLDAKVHSTSLQVCIKMKVITARVCTFY